MGNNNVDIFKTMAVTLDDAEFQEAWNIMVTERNIRSEKRMKTNKRTLRVGSIVEWSGSKSGACTGEVVKVKTKKAIVRQTNGGNIRSHGSNWDIPMSMLRVVG